MMEAYILLISFFIIALVYSSVGFGGGSSYLALLAQPFFHLLPEVIRPTALFCNIIVVTGGTIIFYREGKIDLKEVWPFLLLSVPLAVLGGKMKLDDRSFFLLLGISLIAAAVFLWVQPEKMKNTFALSQSMMFKLLLGGAIGFLSGLVSIGGGIFLAPILHLMAWSEPKKVAALASLYILVNSIGGLAGQFQKGLPVMEPDFIVPLLLAVLVGGQIGSRLGVKKFDPVYVKRITAVLILVAGTNILIDHL